MLIATGHFGGTAGHDRHIWANHDPWLKQTFEQSDCIIMFATENYLDYVKPKRNLRNILRLNNKTNRHRETQKQIYNMVEKKFSKNGMASKCLIPVLTSGGKLSDVPDWISSRFFLYKYHNEPESVFTDSQLYRLLKTQFL